MHPEKFVLFCAGEDSGDILGESLVRECLRQGYKVRGVGGPRMQRAGLESSVDYEMLPVSGFGDVLPRVIRLKRILSHLENLLRSEECVALVCIDYPGFNMKLVPMAESLKKPVLYVAPPQVWAWKRGRIKRLRQARLAVLFDFERKFFEKSGCNAVLLRHPFPVVQGENANGTLLLLPGSRKSQAMRNLPFFVEVASRYHRENPAGKVTVLASRTSLEKDFAGFLQKNYGGTVPEWVSIESVPLESGARAEFFSRCSQAICTPGSATLELALSGVPMVVADVLDPLTYFMGKHFVKTDYFALPNILLQKGAIPEFFFTKGAARREESVLRVAQSLATRDVADARNIAAALSATFAAAESPESLMLEFLGQLV